MRRIAFGSLTTLLAVGLGVSSAAAQAEPSVGGPAPTFSLPDTHGQTHDLAKYRGRWVVLEWLNYDCPFVGKHYRTGNIPSQQEKWTARGVVWLAVVSSAPGKQGYFTPEEMNARGEKEGSHATAVLLDPDGTVGHLYGARTTPHMFVIDPEGVVRYMGGIDDVPSARDADLERATQLVDQALTEATSGKPVSVPTSRPYGCSVKYGGA